MFTPTIDSNTTSFEYFSVPRGNQSLPRFGGEKKFKKANRGQTKKLSRFLIHSSGIGVKPSLSDIKMFSGFQDKWVFVSNFF